MADCLRCMNSVWMSSYKVSAACFDPFHRCVIPHCSAGEHLFFFFFDALQHYLAFTSQNHSSTGQKFTHTWVDVDLEIEIDDLRLFSCQATFICERQEASAKRFDGCMVPWHLCFKNVCTDERCTLRRVGIVPRKCRLTGRRLLTLKSWGTGQQFRIPESGIISNEWIILV